MGAALAAAALLFAAGPLAAEPYRLGVRDKLSIRVVEWRAVEGEFRDWAGVAGDYSVDASGNIYLPFIGEMQASGRTTTEIAKKIGETLQQKFALPDRPDAAVQVAEYRPFFIDGDVKSPGEYPYSPELTVLKAVSVAGGMRRGSDSSSRPEKDLITARGNFDVASDQSVRLLVQRARLDAEMANKTGFEPPEEVKKNPNLPSIVADERALLETRRKKLEVGLKALADLKVVLENQVSSLEEKIKSQTRQVELAREELKSVGGLQQKGLVANTRVLSSEQSVAEMEGKILDYEMAILQARQSISQADKDASDLQNTRDSDVATERQEVQRALSEAVMKTGTQRQLILEAADVAALAATEGQTSLPPLRYTLTRMVDGKPTKLDADENTPVLPGDVLKVVQPLPPVAIQ
ncbi:MAG: polysaccharide biosynthesis/export family protein [Methylobacterium mesophilicum]|nr:polysaccharide biosynthesis/export family protein [Methylobacterium mesophilicum]